MAASASCCLEAGFGDGGEAAQAIAEDDTAGLQAGLGPLADGLGGEAADQIELQVRRATGLVQRQRRKPVQRRTHARTLPLTK